MKCHGVNGAGTPCGAPAAGGTNRCVMHSGRAAEIGSRGGHRRTVVSSGESYDSISNGFMPSGNLLTAREFRTATLLPTGKVLVIGGIDWFPGP